ncbi:MAG: hypothetical protein A2725_03995 [Candidatus Magasanikbacteria bacterium RIFCSPHIGHO2_01_FULL_33_34]|uniref:Uncharacterized protein n=1 Tax=Candidatus Magasanikbacteria bacterium RIFCSPHIGHO2_01_FULL_33_34 TaxID=1798671 RepID=A0A1F6LHJ9_9BACT|nr:MAG: hypothetical protein A2725_03995 [Candidatus Magasanikbacteria bacterium RIFCSPHIGHO2_01_FULL_33_34]OGH65130.1 MAG: hypothetical protein A3B83_03755 [Candidatus Magasanikbacteria bacterium RIFCSPHIGHO2_02_FULL_33_17]OGH75326.1 MAG: hypothetical protein A3A89_04410 [Candidatus Magasanikbacteria bacterium RIFCSPLOWO2_01_FULL_33_34]
MPNSIIRHFHNRKRSNKRKLEPIPHPEPAKRFLDYLIYVICIITPLLILPQIWKIWTTQNAAGISLITYTGLAITNTIWIFYGIAHKEKPIIALYVSLFFINTAIAIGRLLYG